MAPVANRPTPQQLRCIDAIAAGKSFFLSALAGTGKSETLLEGVAKLARKEGRWSGSAPTRGLVVAFNAKIAEEMHDRLERKLGRDPATFGWEVRTLNSVGHSTVAARIAASGRRKVALQLDTKKVAKIVQAMSESDEAMAALKKSLRGRKADRFVMTQALWQMEGLIAGAKAFGARGPALAPDGFLPELLEIATQRGSVPSDNVLSATPELSALVTRALQYNESMAVEDGIVDYGDQTYLAAYSPVIGRRWTSIIFDECQPPGTQIRMAGDTTKNIEDVRVGDMLMSFDSTSDIISGLTRTSHFNDKGGPREPRRVEGIRKKKYNGMLVNIGVAISSNNRPRKNRSGRPPGGTGGLSSYTPEHWCFVHVNKNSTKHLVYLQRRGVNFRLGTTKSIYSLADRLKAEKADASWIISIHDSLPDALFEEHCLSFEYGIPTTTFVSAKRRIRVKRLRHKEGQDDQRYLDAFWKRVGDLSNKAEALLECKKLSPLMPFYERSRNGKGWASTHVVPCARGFKCRAINVFPDIMSVRMLTGGGSGRKISTVIKPIKTVRKTDYDGYVYSLTVSPQKSGLRLYFGDRILTHNCQDASPDNFRQITRACLHQLVCVGDENQLLYDALRGASVKELHKLVKARSMPTLRLTKTFRCSKAIVARQNDNGPVSGFEATAKAPIGDIRYPFFRLPSAGQVGPRWSFRDLNGAAGDARTIGVLSATNHQSLTAVALLLAETPKSKAYYRGVQYPASVWKQAYDGSGRSSLHQAMRFLMEVLDKTPEQACRWFEAAAAPARAKSKWHFGTPFTTKGLEFDCVVLVDGQSFYKDVPVRYVAETRARYALFGVNLPLHELAYVKGHAATKFLMDARTGLLTDSWHPARAKSTKSRKPSIKPYDFMVAEMSQAALLNVPKEFRANSLTAKVIAARGTASTRLTHAEE